MVFIELPAILPSGKSLWEEYWKVDELEKIKATLPISHWEAQYQQNPVSEESAIVKREWWQEWEYREPPACEFIIQSWDPKEAFQNQLFYHPSQRLLHFQEVLALNLYHQNDVFL